MRTNGRSWYLFCTPREGEVQQGSPVILYLVSYNHAKATSIRLVERDAGRAWFDPVQKLLEGRFYMHCEGRQYHLIGQSVHAVVLGRRFFNQALFYHQSVQTPSGVYRKPGNSLAYS